MRCRAETGLFGCYEISSYSFQVGLSWSGRARASSELLNNKTILLGANETAPPGEKISLQTTTPDETGAADCPAWLCGVQVTNFIGYHLCPSVPEAAMSNRDCWTTLAFVSCGVKNIKLTV